MLLAIFFLKERFKLRKILGMLVGLGGIFLIIFEPLLEQGFDGSITGNLLLVLATLGAVGGTITGRKLFTRYDPLTLSFWAFVIGSMTFLPLALYEYASIPNLYPLLDIRGYSGILFGSVLSTAAAYTLYNWGLSKITATDTAMFAYIDPVVGAILGYFMLNERITPLYLLGFLFVFGGIYITKNRVHYHSLLTFFRSKKT